MMIFITGGARSGKSTFGESLLREKQGNVLYIPTAIPFDSEMKDRIRKHRERRPDHWKTLECPEDFQELKNRQELKDADHLMVDCLGVFVSNHLLAYEASSRVEQGEVFEQLNPEELDRLEEDLHRKIDVLLDYGREKNMVVVSNEVGLGLVPEYPLGRAFRDLLGRLNQKMAASADEVYFVISGIPMVIKKGDEGPGKYTVDGENHQGDCHKRREESWKY